VGEKLLVFPSFESLWFRGGTSNFPQKEDTPRWARQRGLLKKLRQMRLNMVSQPQLRSMLLVEKIVPTQFFFFGKMWYNAAKW
jgi:hypothetical protein